VDAAGSAPAFAGAGGAAQSQRAVQGQGGRLACGEASGGDLFGGGAMALVIAFGLSLSWVWAATALLVRNPATVSSLGLAVLLPPTFASNIFVQPRTMPGWLQAFVKVNPISHVADAPRDLMNNTGGAGVIWSLVAILAITLVFAPLTLHLYSKQC
jgi:ABC-2 type transport system permease protein